MSVTPAPRRRQADAPLAAHARHARQAAAGRGARGGQHDGCRWTAGAGEATDYGVGGGLLAGSEAGSVVRVVLGLVVVWRKRSVQIQGYF